MRSSSPPTAPALLEKRPSSTVFGVDKPLIDTPRSASFISDTTLDRYGILTIDKLALVSPGTYTASYYGVAGSLNIRGTYAENYFQGFKRIENRGTYSTPIGDAAQIEIVRGPPSAIYGPAAGKVGGMLNFIPKSAEVDGAFINTSRHRRTDRHPGRLRPKTQCHRPYRRASETGRRGRRDLRLWRSRGLAQLLRAACIRAASCWRCRPISTSARAGAPAFGGMYFHSDGADVQTLGWKTASPRP